VRICDPSRRNPADGADGRVGTHGSTGRPQQSGVAEARPAYVTEGTYAVTVRLKITPLRVRTIQQTGCVVPTHSLDFMDGSSLGRKAVASD
jgi:hypothetical protein